MSDLLCRVCGEPWDAWGLHHGDVMAWEAKLFKAGAGCPCCKGIDPSPLDPSVREARDLAAAESMAENWDDPHSFPFVNAMLGCPEASPARPKWLEPPRRVLATCAGCSVQLVEALRYSLSEENAKDQRHEWEGGDRVHYLRGVAFTYGDLPGGEEPDPDAMLELDGKQYCPGCAQHCDGPSCRAVIFSRSDLEGDSYSPGKSFPEPGDEYSGNSYCWECFEKLDNELQLELRQDARTDAARQAWRMKENEATNDEVREMIQREMRRFQ